MISDRAARYAIGYVIGAAHERAGIIDLEEGYPCDEMYRAGMRRGRADFRRAIDSLLIPEEIGRAHV